MALQRLDRLIASAGICSRREARDLAHHGQILVDGIAARSSGEKVDPAVSSITVAGQEVLWRRHTYVMLHKPSGVLSASADRRTATVVDLLAPEHRRRGLFPVGRLDKDATGLLLLTDDGPLSHRLLSPRRHVDKEYRIEVQGRLTESDCAAMAAGMTLPDGLHCLPAQMSIRSAAAVSVAHVILHEGKYHQLKRMLAHLGKPVLTLHRIRMGNLTLDAALPPGRSRLLTPSEVSDLRDLAADAGKKQIFHKK